MAAYDPTAFAKDVAFSSSAFDFGSGGNSPYGTGRTVIRRRPNTRFWTSLTMFALLSILPLL